MLRGGTGRCRGLVLPKLSSVSSCKCTLGKFSGEGWQIVRGLLSTDGRNILFENPTWYPSFPDTPLPSPLQTGSDSPDAGRECRMHLTHPSAPPPPGTTLGSTAPGGGGREEDLHQLRHEALALDDALRLLRHSRRGLQRCDPRSHAARGSLLLGIVLVTASSPGKSSSPPRSCQGFCPTEVVRR